MEQYLHGAEVVQIDSGPRTITTTSSSVIGLVGVAPKGPVNTPVLIHGSKREAVDLFGSPGYGFSIPDALDGIFDQCGALVVVINVADPDDETQKTIVAAAPMAFSAAGKIQLPKVAISAVALTGPVTAPMYFSGDTLALPEAATAPVIKSADGATTYVLDTDYTLADTTITIKAGGAIVANQQVLVTYTVAGITADVDFTVDADNGIITQIAGGKLVPSCAMNVAYSYLDPTKVEITKVVGGVDGVTGQYTGVHALLSAASAVAVTPRILAAPGFTHQRTGGSNPVVAELLGIAEKLRAAIIADGPNATDAAAISYRQDFGSARVYPVDPWVRVLNPVTGATEDQPASARVAGLIAKSDNDRGFWWSPSNQEIAGIVGTSRPVEFAMGDVSCRANVLNANQVATIIYQGGYRLWGNRSCSIDPKWAFLSVRRTADMINDSLLRAHLWAVDRAITKTYLSDVLEGVNEYIRHLTAIGAVLGGRAWADPELNTPDQIADGKVYIDFDFTPPFPAEHIIFRSHLVNDYITEVFK